MAEHAHAGGALAQLVERGRQLRVAGRGAQVEVEVILPGPAAQRAALDLDEVDAAPREGLQRVVERARAVRELEDERELVGLAFAGRLGREQDEARVVLAVVFEPFAQDVAAVDFRRATARDGGARSVAAAQDGGDAPGGVVGGDAADVGARGEETFALREGDGVRLDGLHAFGGRAGEADEEVPDGDDDLGRHVERAVEEQVVDAVDGAGERVLDGREREVGRALADGREERLEGRARDESHLLAQELDGRLLAEGPALALEGNARRAGRRAHLAAPSGRAASPVWSRRDSRMTARKRRSTAPSSSGPRLFARARSITSRSRPRSQTESPATRFDSPTRTAISARAFSSRRSSASILSISTRQSSMVICQAPCVRPGTKRAGRDLLSGVAAGSVRIFSCGVFKSLSPTHARTKSARPAAPRRGSGR